MDPLTMSPVYNVDCEEGWTVAELAEMVAGEVSRRSGEAPVAVNLSNQAVDEKFGMSIKAIEDETGWRPRFTTAETVRSTVEAVAEGASRG
jgi:nucleoside-diphosphate-sugar epimerase